jgi:hypothetical protein
VDAEDGVLRANHEERWRFHESDQAQCEGTAQSHRQRLLRLPGLDEKRVSDDLGRTRQLDHLRLLPERLRGLDERLQRNTERELL